MSYRPVEERLADGHQSPSERLAEAIRAEMADAVERTVEERLDRIEALLSGLQSGASASGGEWLTSEEAARYLRLDPTEFRRRAAAGKIPRHNLTGERGYRYYVPELREWGRSR